MFNVSGYNYKTWSDSSTTTATLNWPIIWAKPAHEYQEPEVVKSEWWKVKKLKEVKCDL